MSPPQHRAHPRRGRHMGRPAEHLTMPTVLLVEDTSELARTIARELELSGYEVLLAQDGVHALDLHAQHRPDLVILDWMLPKLDGLEVLRKLRQSAATPVLMLTARDDEAD